MRPTLKQEDYANTFQPRTKVKKARNDDSNFVDTDEEQLVAPDYRARERQVQEHQQSINALFDQSAVSGYGEFAV